MAVGIIIQLANKQLCIRVKVSMMFWNCMKGLIAATYLSVSSLKPAQLLGA